VFRRKTLGGAKRPEAHPELRRCWCAPRSWLKDAENFTEPETVEKLTGPWTVSFDPRWGGPEQATFETLDDWAKRPEDGIRFYSGTAIYRISFDVSNSEISNRKSESYLDLGRVKNLARVRLNHHDLGVVWTAPWRVDITRAVKQKGNDLEIEVVNLWPNRLIGDASLPREQRRTVTNVGKFNRPGATLLESGLLGPVSLQVAQPAKLN
jgi:hypothetical protein